MMKILAEANKKMLFFNVITLAVNIAIDLIASRAITFAVPFELIALMEHAWMMFAK